MSGLPVLMRPVERGGRVRHYNVPWRMTESYKGGREAAPGPGFEAGRGLHPISTGVSWYPALEVCLPQHKIVMCQEHRLRVKRK